MYTETSYGRKLNKKFRTFANDEAIGILSVIHRWAKTYANIQERWCNGFPNYVKLPDGRRIWENGITEKQEKYLKNRETQIEKRVTELCRELSEVIGFEIIPFFNGDPRGSSIILQVPEEYNYLADDWGKRGICVEE